MKHSNYFAARESCFALVIFSCDHFLDVFCCSAEAAVNFEMYVFSFAYECVAVDHLC
jgi:hypothetical protein